MAEEQVLLLQLPLEVLQLGDRLAPLIGLLIGLRGPFARALAGDRAMLDWFAAHEGDSRLLLSLEATSLAQETTLLAWLAIAATLAAALWLGRPAARG